MLAAMTAADDRSPLAGLSGFSFVFKFRFVVHFF